MSSATRPDRRRASRAVTKSQARTTQSHGTRAHKPAPRKSPARPQATGSGGSMLNTLIIALLVVLALMAVAFFVLLTRFVV